MQISVPVALAVLLLTGCATFEGNSCPSIRKPLLTIMSHTRFVTVSTDDLLSWTSRYERIPGNVGRNFFLKGPKGSGILQVHFGPLGHRRTLELLERVWINDLADRGDPQPFIVVCPGVSRI